MIIDPLVVAPCPHCDGDGYIWSLTSHEQDRCSVCAGLGEVEVIEVELSDVAA